MLSHSHDLIGDAMSFGTSAQLAWTYDQAPALAALPLIEPLVTLLGGTPADAERLARKPFRNGELQDLAKWTHRITSIGPSEVASIAKVYWAAQALAVPVFSRNPLAPEEVDEAAVRMLQKGADALYEVGAAQFECLRTVALEVVAWFLDCRERKMVLLESPLGNSLPVQVAAKLAKAAGLEPSIITWNAPRNDKPGVGRTVNDSAKDFAAQVDGSAIVVLLDDVLTGTRFIKTYDALRKVLKGRLLPIAMVFEAADALPNSSKQIERVKRRMGDAAKTMKFSRTFQPFPKLPEFHIDDKGAVRWSTPMIWGETDLIAGKRKVNLVFNLLDHLFFILKELASSRSEVGEYLEHAWQRNTDGEIYTWMPGLRQQTFAQLLSKVDFSKLQSELWSAGRAKYPHDYMDVILSLPDEDVQDRWVWLKETFLKLASKKLEPKESYLLWRGFDDAFAASHNNVRFRPSRDHAYAAYAIPYNSTVRALHERLIDQVAQK